MPVVLQYVEEGSPNLERRAQCASMIPIRKHGTAPPDAHVQAPGQAHREPLHRARKRALSLCLDDEVKMIGLNGVLHEPYPEPLPGSSESREHKPRERPVPETREPSPDLHRNVQRMSLLEFGTPHVRYARLRARGLSTCPLSSAAAKPERQIELS
jgi:hypothetical protein